MILSVIPVWTTEHSFFLPFLDAHHTSNVPHLPDGKISPSTNLLFLPFCRGYCHHLTTLVYSSSFSIIIINSFWNIYFFLLTTFTSSSPLWKVLRMIISYLSISRTLTCHLCTQLCFPVYNFSSAVSLGKICCPLHILSTNVSVSLYEWASFEL